jgi:hypothetical protein
VPEEIGDRGHDLGDTGLSSAPAASSVARDDVVADASAGRKQIRIEHLPRVAGKLIGAPPQTRCTMETFALTTRRRVDVGDQADRRCSLLAREARADGRAGVQVSVVEPQRSELVDEQTGQVELLLGARASGDPVGALGVDRDVAQEPLEHVGRELLRVRLQGARALLKLSEPAIRLAQFHAKRQVLAGGAVGRVDVDSESNPPRAPGRASRRAQDDGIDPPTSRAAASDDRLERVTSSAMRVR